ncbi:hypothetical protein [Mucilaginibacter sp. OK283]|jgi:uncharacterized membrane protein HdeD (DUF308 family)|uniref:hypothetical protein n=1 Tax=Mucilaginibacter sp. OK283 TaxID=1881049 RepID=UPI0008B1D210|nr:hypothetical protein [Mucilaginibacter sp. OK283]SEO05489.1 hypothetical protein SAMN05428947_101133 [Mucilaginibacter sp. OK283]
MKTAPSIARSLCKLYFIRAGFSITWVIIVALFAKTSPIFATILLLIYPAWDVIGTILDIRANRAVPSKTPQYINLVISGITTFAVAVAIQKGVPEALVVFGAWAICTGLIQLILGLRRRKLLGGQWPMIISGGQSMIGGISFILLAHDTSKGIGSLAGYAAFGAFYYLLAAYRLSRTANPTAN